MRRGLGDHCEKHSSGFSFLTSPNEIIAHPVKPFPYLQEAPHR